MHTEATTQPQLPVVGQNISRIEWFDIQANQRGHVLRGDQFSLWRSKKGNGVTFSGDITKRLQAADIKCLQVGKTITGHIVLLFSESRGTGITVSGANARSNSKDVVDLFAKLMNAPAGEFRKVYNLKKGEGEQILYFIDGEEA